MSVFQMLQLIPIEVIVDTVVSQARLWSEGLVEMTSLTCSSILSSALHRASLAITHDHSRYYEKVRPVISGEAQSLHPLIFSGGFLSKVYFNAQHSTNILCVVFEKHK